MPLPNILGVASQAASPLLGIPNTAQNSLYAINEYNWFRSLPYGFAFYDINSNGKTPTSTIYLPIAPSNLNISTHFATNIVTTLYGVVEEHSEVRYFDIVISGTTGMAPQYTQAFSGISVIEAKSPGRQDFEAATVPALLATLSSTAAILSSQNPTYGLAEISTELLTDRNNPNVTGIGTRQTGYWAFHQLYQFFLKYKIDTSRVGSIDNAQSSIANGIKTLISSVVPLPAPKPRANHPLQFLNYKDGNRYDCIPVTFSLRRSAENPMLYYYDIRLKAFNLRTVTGGPVANDELGKMGIGDSSASATVGAVVGGAALGLSLLLNH